LKNIKIILEYDGTGFSGWQFQPRQRTLQGTLEDAIKATTGEELRVTASGRTDAGVHAYGQAVNFKTESNLDERAWLGALNHYLPRQMRVQGVEEVGPDFSARFDAKGKQYDYIIINRAVPSPIHRKYAWHVGIPLDFEAMEAAARELVGEHDFTSLRATDCDSNTPIRELRSLEVIRDGDRIRLSLKAGGFLRHMVRNIAGTLVEVGRGRFSPEDMKTILEARDRTKAGPTAPPQGLYLVKVEY